MRDQRTSTLAVPLDRTGTAYSDAQPGHCCVVSCAHTIQFVAVVMRLTSRFWALSAALSSRMRHLERAPGLSFTGPRMILATNFHHHAESISGGWGKR
jgi:diadenosine tetraphosphate (Ap4A) HIT family hydrolase